MEQQTLTGLSRISLLLALIMFRSLHCLSQKSIAFSAGAGINQAISTRANAGDLKNDGKGKSSYLFDINGKFKFNSHISLSVQYLMLKNHLRVEFDNMTVGTNSHQTQPAGLIGNMTFRDNLYLYGNAGGINFNYEIPAQKNNIVISLGILRTYYNSKKNYITRDYSDLPSTTKFSTINPHQNSSLEGSKLTSINFALSYERLLYKNKLGFFTKLTYIYNFYGNFFQYEHSGLGLFDNYNYTYQGRTISTMHYYTLSFQTVGITAGIFLKINLNEKSN